MCIILCTYIACAGSEGCDRDCTIVHAYGKTAQLCSLLWALFNAPKSHKLVQMLSLVALFCEGLSKGPANVILILIPIVLVIL